MWHSLLLLFSTIVVASAAATGVDENDELRPLIAEHHHRGISIQQQHFESIANEIENESEKWIKRLGEAVEIPSVSASPDTHPEVLAMIDWTRKLMESLGIECEQIANKQLPPVLFGTLRNPKATKTVLIYGHLDVMPANVDDGWHSDPFKLIQRNGKLYGRGSTDDKGPVIGWLNVIETMQKLNIDIPVNIKFVLEGMEESGSIGLDDILIAHKDTFLADIDFVVISDNYWLGKNTPCITYGLRGRSDYAIEISGPKQDLHSGVHGGIIHEPMNDLCWILSTLTDVNGRIQIDGIEDLVAPLSDEERALYETIDFNLEDYKADVGFHKLISDNPTVLLMNRMRQPTLSIHGIEGAFSGKGQKTIIPAKVIGKFSIRTVPNMQPEQIDRLVNEYLEKKWHERGSPNHFKVIAAGGTPPWLGEFKHPNFKAAEAAIKKVFGKAPDFTREGGSIPVTLTFEQITGKNVLLLPIGASDDGAHSQNEKINVSNYLNGMKVFAAYLLELAKL